MKPVPPNSPGNAPGLHRTLGLGEVTAGGVGIIIGAGIYVLIGAATAYPSAAAEYEYTRQALPEWIAFVVSWVTVVVCAAGVIAAFLPRPGNRSAAA